MATIRRTTLSLATAFALAALPVAAYADDNDGDGWAPALYRVNLVGGAVPGDAGDTGAVAGGLITLLKDDGELCWDLAWSHLSANVTGIHLHKGATGATGPHAVDFVDDADLAGSKGSSAGCTEVDGDKLDAMLADPQGYYAQIHTADHAKGAVRGQLEEDVDDSGNDS